MGDQAENGEQTLTAGDASAMAVVPRPTACTAQSAAPALMPETAWTLPSTMASGATTRGSNSSTSTAEHASAVLAESPQPSERPFHGRNLTGCVRAIRFPHPHSSMPSEAVCGAAQCHLRPSAGQLQVLRQSGAETLVTAEPDAFIWARPGLWGAWRTTAGSTRQAAASSLCSSLAAASGSS